MTDYGWRKLDHMVSMAEQFGYGVACPDCEVGEPHCCPLVQPTYMKQERRRYEILTALAGDSRDA